MALVDATSLAHIQQLEQGKKLALLHFWASWCEPCKQMDAVMQQLAQEHPDVAFIRVEAEVADEASIRHDIANVPTIVLEQAGRQVGRVEGADPAGLTQALQAALSDSKAAAAPGPATATPPPAAETDENADVTARIKYLLAQHAVLLAMKGSADAPRCKFSSRVVRVLKELQVTFHGVDILQDESLRQGFKAFASWPTYPQLYVQGELVGGCDIIEEMHASGELKELLQTKAPAAQPAAAAVATAPAAAVATAPTLAAPAAPVQDLNARLSALVRQQPVMLFMKGTPDQPRCGFSSKVVSALRSLAVPFGHFDILGDEEVRHGLKQFSNWPTYPQLYVGGELLGGCDIVLQMQEAGELASTIQDMQASAPNAAS